MDWKISLIKIIDSTQEMLKIIETKGTKDWIKEKVHIESVRDNVIAVLIYTGEKYMPLIDQPIIRVDSYGHSYEISYKSLRMILGNDLFEDIITKFCK